MATNSSPFTVASWTASSCIAALTRCSANNWGLPRIDNGSADAIAGTLGGFFDFDRPASFRRLFLDPTTGQVSGGDDDH